jgi:hypothetical protein
MPVIKTIIVFSVLNYLSKDFYVFFSVYQWQTFSFKYLLYFFSSEELSSREEPMHFISFILDVIKSMRSLYDKIYMTYYFLLWNFYFVYLEKVFERWYFYWRNWYCYIPNHRSAFFSRKNALQKFINIREQTCMLWYIIKKKLKMLYFETYYRQSTIYAKRYTYYRYLNYYFLIPIFFILYSILFLLWL